MMSYLINKKNQKIAYTAIKGQGPGIVFIHGLNSNMEGKKALNIEKYAKVNNLSFIRFDFRGHGRSYGKFEDFNITDWKEDILNIIDNLTTGPQILIGSSMGGWIMTLAAKYRYKRIAGLIGLAAALDFSEDLYKSLSSKNKKDIKHKGYTEYILSGFSYTLTKKFFTEAKKNNLLSKPIKYKKPLTLIHGLEDDVVKSEMPKKIMKAVTGKNVNIIYLKTSDHRLSKKHDLLTINHSIDNIRSLL